MRRLRRALAEKGIPFDRKNFNPHITLVRKAFLKNGLPENLLKESGLRTTDADLVSLMQQSLSFLMIAANFKSFISMIKSKEQV